MSLQHRIEALAAAGKTEFDAGDFELFVEFRKALSRGAVRAAARDDSGAWHANAWVKQGILIGFRMGRLTDVSPAKTGPRFFDRHTYPLHDFSVESNVRLVPGGTSVRDGSYLAPGVVVMPPSYINVGAYVDEGTMIDSHVLVGSCAQVGKRVHLSAAVQVGGVLEPTGAVPVVIEDDAFLGGGCGVYEGTIVRARAVLAPGVILSGSTPVFDLVQQKVLRRTPDAPLEIPPGAVVVPGARPADGDFARTHGVALYAPVIIKYRDEKTSAATTLEEALR